VIVFGERHLRHVLRCLGDLSGDPFSTRVPRT